MKPTKQLILGLMLFMGVLTQAQVNVNINVGNPPAWGPAGYTDVRYYYLPDIDAYYDVTNTQYIYVNNGAWTRKATLPPAYRNYDLYNGYKVVMTDYRGNEPYHDHDNYRAKYPKGYKGQPQKTNGPKPAKANKPKGNNGNKTAAHPNNGKGNGGKGKGGEHKK